MAKAKESAGLLMYRIRSGQIEVLLAHPGGPFFARKDQGSWTVPKGEIEASEGPLSTACREFEEELGLRPTGPFLPLDRIRQKGGKIVHAWAFCGDYDTSRAPPSNRVRLEWPPKSGRIQEFPELDRVAFFPLVEAREKINPAQCPFLDRLQEQVDESSPGELS